jgi:choline kinase
METKNCLILAAGLGSRIANLAKSKPLLEVAGKPLIHHVLENAKKAGMEKFYVVSGYNGHILRSFLDYYSGMTDTQITHVINEDWESPNGVSVLAAEEYLQDQFSLLMSDHLFDPTILSDLNKLSISDHEVVLAVDDNMDNKFVVLDDVTRVKTKDNAIIDIGKEISDFNAYDTGIFKCGTKLFDALKESAKAGDQSLTGGIRQLIKTKNAKCYNINKRIWVDVDDEGVMEMAIKNFPF